MTFERHNLQQVSCVTLFISLFKCSTETLYLLFFLFLLLFLVLLTLRVCYYDDYFPLQLVRGVTLAQGNFLVHCNRL